MLGMEVNPNAGTNPLRGVTNSTPVTSAAKPQGRDSVLFEEADAVNGALQQTPAVRPDAVERARTLITDTQYPTQPMIDSISRLVAARLNSNDAQP